MDVAPLYRTFWRRFWAGYVDLLVLGPAMAVDFWIQHHWTSSAARAWWFACYSAVFPAYQIYMHGRFGQTVGKRLLRVKVVDVSGSPLTMTQALRRELINLPFAVWSCAAICVFILNGGNPYDEGARPEYGPPSGLFLGLFGLELMSTLGSFKRRALHDLLAGSVVIRLGVTDAAPSKEVSETVREPPLRSPTQDEFTCTACGSFVRLGASHCHACDQLFVYRDGHPTALE